MTQLEDAKDMNTHLNKRAKDMSVARIQSTDSECVHPREVLGQMYMVMQLALLSLETQTACHHPWHRLWLTLSKKPLQTKQQRIKQV